MAIALISVAFVGVGFSAWVGLLAQRGRTGEVEEHATRRRVAASNTRASIKVYALQRAITSSIDSDGLSFNPTALGGWSDTSTAPWNGYAMESTTRIAGLNAFSCTWDYPYSKILDVNAKTKSLGFATSEIGAISASYGISTSYLRTYLRSRSPILGGDLLLLHRSSRSPEAIPAVIGNIRVAGRVVHFVPEVQPENYTARSARFDSPPGVTVNAAPKDLAGNSIAPSNLSWTPITFGRRDGAYVADFTGRLNVVDAPNNGGNSLKARVVAAASTIQDSGTSTTTDARGYSNPGTGTVTITQCVGLTSPADLPSIVLTDEIREIIIDGQTGSNFSTYAPFRPAFAVLYTQNSASNRKLNTIRLRNQGARRMLLAIKQATPVGGTPVNIIIEDSNAICEWNAIIVAENTPLTVTLSGGATTLNLVGGIQTDSSLTLRGTSTRMQLLLQTDTRGLIRLAPRAAWVETIMPDKIPGSSTLENTW